MGIIESDTGNECDDKVAKNSLLWRNSVLNENRPTLVIINVHLDERHVKYMIFQMIVVCLFS